MENNANPGILQKIKYPADLRKLKQAELPGLASEIRERIISTVSETGGRLASNLRVMELTIALHYVYETPMDKIVWNVGRQCYAHKILTGRNEQFHSIRQHKGISGYPLISESEYDAFSAGHASTSISAALGMAIARDIRKEKLNARFAKPVDSEAFLDLYRTYDWIFTLESDCRTV